MSPAEPAAQKYLRRLRWSALLFVLALGGGIVTFASGAAALLGQIAVSINWVRQRRKESRVLKVSAPAGESSGGLRSR